jgi:hypothetical protein
MICTMTIRMVWSAGVFSGANIVVMGTVGVTTLHPQEPRDPEFPPAPKVAPPLTKGILEGDGQ